MEKTLSILMAVRNGAKFLTRTLDSLFEDFRTDFELIAVDDASIDESRKILSRYPLKLIECDAPVGLARARNLAVREASAAFTTFFDQDDVLVPRGFSNRIDYLIGHPEFPLVAGEIADVIDGNDARLGCFYELSGKRRGDFVLTWERVRAKEAIPGALWLYLFRTGFLKSMGPFQAEWEELSDQELLYRILRRFDVPCRAIPVGRYRVHGGNTTVQWDKGHIGVRARAKALGTLLSMKYGLLPLR